MSVFVCVEMCDVDTGALQLLYLSESLALDVVLTDLATQ